MTESKSTEFDPKDPWKRPKEVSDIRMAFPGGVIGSYLPEINVSRVHNLDESDFPKSERFFAYRHEWERMAEMLFFGNVPDGEMVLYDGVDPDMMQMHTRVCLGSWEPKHEHKISGVGYLLSKWIAGIKSSTVNVPLPDGMSWEEAKE